MTGDSWSRGRGFEFDTVEIIFHAWIKERSLLDRSDQNVL